MNDILMNFTATQMATSVQYSTRDNFKSTEQTVGNDVQFKEAMDKQVNQDEYETDYKQETASKQNETDHYEKKESVVSKKHMLTKNESVLNQVQEKPLSDEEKLGAMEAHILQLLSTHLNIPVEHIQEQLQTLQMEPVDLLSQDNFMVAMKSLVGENELSVMGNSDVLRDIGKLWDGLEDVKEEALKEGLILDTTALEQTTGESIVPTTLANNTSNGNEQHTSEGSEQESVHITQGGDSLASDAFTLPIQNILDTQSHKVWQQEAKEALGMKHTEHTPINKQILDKADFVALTDGNEITVELDPEELGKIVMKVSEHNGVVTTSLKVENERAKEMLLENLETMKKELEEKGLEMGSFQVDVQQNNQKNQMEQQKQKASKRIQEIINKHMGELEGTEGVASHEEVLNVPTNREVNLKA